MTTEDKQLIIGAGPAGLAHAKALKYGYVRYDQVEAQDEVGGNWYNGTYESAHIISSKKISQYDDYPMPEHYPDFPSRQNIFDYLKDYAQHFKIYDKIEFNKKVEYVRPIEDNKWQVTFEDGEQRNYKGVLVCNGHHWCKKWPEYSGEFSGEYIHSKDYKTTDQLKGKKILVIGAGNSACDIASEAARVGSECMMSMRSGTYFLPKTIMGKPLTDHKLLALLPVFVQRTVLNFYLNATVGDYKDYGLQKPDFKIFEKHPTVSTEVLHYIKHGRIIPKPGITKWNDKTVYFNDGSQENFDLIIAATGYHLSWPFLPEELHRVKGPIAQVYGGSMYDDYNGLYIVGTTQPRGGFGSLLTPSSNMMARMIALQNEIDIPMGMVLKKLGEKIPTSHLQNPVTLHAKMKMANIFFPLLKRRAKMLDKKYPNYRNKIVDPIVISKSKKTKKRKTVKVG